MDKPTPTTYNPKQPPKTNPHTGSKCRVRSTVKKILIEIHPKIIGARKAFSFLENLIIKGFVVEAYCEHVWALRR
jgi:hypothetical protein